MGTYPLDSRIHAGMRLIIAETPMTIVERLDGLVLLLGSASPL
jgi:hypothetical protein